VFVQLKRATWRAVMVVILCTSLWQGGAFASQPTETIPETKDRLSLERMRLLVSTPLEMANRGDLDAAIRRFEIDLASDASASKEAVHRADMLMAFGVLLYADAMADPFGSTRHKTALAYVDRATHAYRSARGANHPDLAVALHSQADLILAIEGRKAPLLVGELLEEAYRIRAVTLGEHNAETAMTLLHLGAFRGLPEQTGGDAAKIAEAANLIEKAMMLERGAPIRKAGDQQWMMSGLILLHLYNRQVDQADHFLDKAVEAFDAEIPPGRVTCSALTSRLVDRIAYAEMSNSSADKQRVEKVQERVMSRCEQVLAAPR
jgi:hypothetical protein